MATSKQIDALLAAAQRAPDFTEMSAEEFIATLIDTIPTLADEFDTVRLQVGSRALPLLRADLHRGITLRVLDLATAAGLDRQTVVDTLMRDEYPILKRIAAYAALYPSVELALPSDSARQLASDLARGSAARGTDSATLIATWQASA